MRKMYSNTPSSSMAHRAGGIGLASPATPFVPRPLTAGPWPLAPDPWSLDFIWFLVWVVASSIWCITAATRLGATFDEPIYVTRGLECWRTGSHAGLMQLGTMPLAIDLDTLPLYIYERWQHIAFDPEHDLAKLLPWARAGTLFFWWLLLGYGWLIGRQLAGQWGGRLAVAFLACEPSLLAHAGLATTDIALTACLSAFAYHFRRGREAHWFWRVGVPSFWFAAAILAKASGLVFGPLCIFVLEAEHWLRRPRTKLETRSSKLACRSLWDLVQIAAFGLGLTFLYCGSDWRAESSFVAWAHQLSPSPLGRAMVWTAEHLRIFSNAGDGLVRQIRHNIRGHGTYLLGIVAQRALWYYFPIAVTVKTALPFLLLPLAILILRARALWNWPFLTALAFLVFSVTCRVQIGIRLVLPLIAFGLVGVAAALAQGVSEEVARTEGRETRDQGRRSRKWQARFLPRPWILVPRASLIMTTLACAGLLWTAASALWIWPDGLCYTNEFWGGTPKGYLVLSDSNYDWGQGLNELARWRETHADAPLDVWYFGTDPRLQEMAVRPMYFHTLPIGQAAEALKWVEGHYLAVSTTLLHGSVYAVLPEDSPERKAYLATQSFFRERTPSARTATFLIYDFRAVKNEVVNRR